MSSANLARNGTPVSFLVLLVAFACFTTVHGSYKCNPSKFRKDCGYSGINEKQCLGKGCCWDPVRSNGTPWCFVKNSGYKYCSPTVKRVDCGYYGIKQAECVDRGCCWDEKPGDSWCFFPNANIDPKTCPYYDRKDCGYYGINQDQCEARGCCWSPKPGDKWCFYAKKKSTT